MKQVWHIFRKDLRRMWPWLILLALGLGSRLFLAFRDPPDSGPFAGAMLGTVIFPLICGLVAARLIQEDSAVGTKPYWLARPISRWSLLGAKTLFVTLFLVLIPLLVHLGALIAFRVEAERLPGLLFWGLVTHVALIAPMVVLAAITPNLGFFALACVVAFFGMQARTMLLPSEFWPDTVRTRMVVLSILMLTASGGLVAFQYLQRRTRRTIIATLGAFILVLAADAAIRSDFLFPMPVRTAAGLPEARVSLGFNREAPALEYSADGELLGFHWADTTNSEYMKLLGFFDIQRPPAGYLLRTRWTESEIAYADGTRLNSSPRNRNRLGGSPLPAEFVEFNDETPKRERGPSLYTLFEIDYEGFDRHQDREGKLEVTFGVEAIKAEIIASLPLKPGTKFRSGSLHVEISRADAYDGQLEIHVTGGYIRPEFGSTGQPRLLIVNRARRELFRAAAGYRRAHHGLVVGGATLQWWVASGGYTRQFLGPGRFPFSIDEEWVRGAEVVICHDRPVGGYVRTVTADNFRMSDFTLDSWHERHVTSGVATH